ncbi:MAG: hypothetical protein HY474_00095 [Candidatus Sungbacteria bacterium]|uniref:Uncharacterized protein n=1 Tax=Candidatus Sungiibacteriota bacterium TaxID=2750080 RepID=A0A932YVB0_9BACT|nr:hypothetical protein [Candidatus Sungbacteria bacterium]
MPKPADFDILGIGVFTFITAVSIWALKTHRPLPRWILFLLLMIGVLGFFIDGTIVYLTYLVP